MTLESIRYKNGNLEILDQLLIPVEMKYIPIKSTVDGWNAINKMQVRGAPAIAIVGSLSLAIELSSMNFESKIDLKDFILKQCDSLITSRPTAVNLQISLDKIKKLAESLEEDSVINVSLMKERIIKEAESMLKKDVEDNRNIGRFGAEKICKYRNGKVKILTHCNTGSLATAGYGTALGVIRCLHSLGKLDRAYMTETRPYMQGSRLTSYELLHEGIPSTLICDSAVSFLFKKQDITAVVVGADRVASNGDVANKIGTYQLAVSAKHHGVPFFVAAPFSSIDFNTSSGDDIEIEERSHSEMTMFKNFQITPKDVHCWNPSFDCTPSNLIEGIITEKGVFGPTELSRN